MLLDGTWLATLAFSATERAALRADGIAAREAAAEGRKAPRSCRPTLARQFFDDYLARVVAHARPIAAFAVFDSGHGKTATLRYSSSGGAYNARRDERREDPTAGIRAAAAEARAREGAPDRPLRPRGALAPARWARDAGWDAAVAHPLYEGDDLAATLCALLSREGLAGAPRRILVAGADEDYASLLQFPRVAWLRTHEFATRARPQQWELVTSESFLAEWGLPAEYYADYLGVLGKADDGVPGMKGVGARQARALVRQFGPLEAFFEAADRGELRGFPRRTQQSVDDASQRRAALRARALLSLRSEADVLPDALARVTEDWRSRDRPRRAAELGVSSRLHADVSAALAGMGIEHENECVTESGLVADIGVLTHSHKLAIEVQGPTHFEPDRRLNGMTKKKLHALRRDGWHTLSLPYFEWNELETKQQKAAYLKRALKEDVYFAGRKTQPNLAKQKRRRETAAAAAAAEGGGR